MKKVFGISMALVIVAALLTGCKGGNATSSSPPAVTTTSSTAATTSAAATTSTAPKTTTAATSTAPATTSAAATTSTAPKSTTTTPATSTPAASTTTPSTTATSGNAFASVIAKAAGYTTYSCDISMTATTGGTTTSSTGKEWIKIGNPTKFKMEITSGGYTSDIIYDGQFYYTYDPITKYATKMSVPPSQPSGSSATQYNPVYTTSKTVNGYACAGYTYTDSSGVLTTMWVSTQYGVVVEFVTPTSTIDYSNFNFTTPLPDSTFQLPADAIMMTIPGMP